MSIRIAPVLGELDRVADQVDQHLLGAQRIGLDAGAGTCLSNSTSNASPFFVAHGPASARSTSATSCGRSQCELLDRQLLRFDLRDVQDVVDDRQQVLAVAADRARRTAAARRPV